MAAPPPSTDAVRSYLKVPLKSARKAEVSFATLKRKDCPECALDENNRHDRKNRDRTRMESRIDD